MSRCRSVGVTSDPKLRLSSARSVAQSLGRRGGSGPADLSSGSRLNSAIFSGDLGSSHERVRLAARPQHDGTPHRIAQRAERGRRVSVRAQRGAGAAGE